MKKEQTPEGTNRKQYDGKFNPIHVNNNLQCERSNEKSRDFQIGLKGKTQLYTIYKKPPLNIKIRIS